MCQQSRVPTGVMTVVTLVLVQMTATAKVLVHYLDSASVKRAGAVKIARR